MKRGILLSIVRSGQKVIYREESHVIEVNTPREDIHLIIDELLDAIEEGLGEDDE